MSDDSNKIQLFIGFMTVLERIKTIINLLALLNIPDVVKNQLLERLCPEEFEKEWDEVEIHFQDKVVESM